MSFTNPRIYVVTGKDDNNWQSDDECLFRRGPKWRWQLLLFEVKKLASNKFACEIHASFEISVPLPDSTQTSIRIRETVL